MGEDGPQLHRAKTALTSRRVLLAAPLAWMASACARQPDLIAGEKGRVAQVMDGDALRLDSGVAVRLAEIEAPRRADPYGREAAEMLTAAAMGRQASLWYGGLTRDGYDRAIAHVIASDETGRDVWLNGVMARSGAARVRSFPDNARRVRALYKLEQEARAARRGLWALEPYRVRTTDDPGPPVWFVVIEGALLGVKEIAGQGRARIETAGITLLAGDLMGPQDRSLDLPAKRVRVRGRLEADGAGQAIRLTHWGQIEALA